MNRLKNIKGLFRFHSWHRHIDQDGLEVRGCTRCNKLQYRHGNFFFAFAEGWTYSKWLKFREAKTNHEQLIAMREG